MSEYTPLPWEHAHRVVISKWGNTVAECDRSYAVNTNAEPQSHEIRETEAIANAEYIVTACNHYPFLISAVHLALATLGTIRTHAPREEYMGVEAVLRDAISHSVGKHEVAP